MGINYSRYATPVTAVTTFEEPFDPSSYLSELGLPDALQAKLLAGWRWELVELGGDVRTVTSAMLEERTDEELLSIPGIRRKELALLRAAVKQDPSLNPFW